MRRTNGVGELCTLLPHSLALDQSLLASSYRRLPLHLLILASSPLPYVMLWLVLISD